MKVLYRLTSIVSAIGDDTVATRKTLGCSDFWNSLKDRGYVCAIFRIYCICGRNMNLGYRKNMYGSLRVYITESINVFVLIYLR